MKRQKLLFLFIIAIFAGMLSCSKEEFTETEAIQYENQLDSLQQIRDSLEKVGGIIEYSINVVEAGGSGWTSKDATGIPNANITVSQYGKTITKTTTESGMAVFSDLRVGTVNVSVQMEGYTSVDYVALLKPETNMNINIWYGVTRFAATMVPMFSLTDDMSTLSGVVTYESNLTNTTPELAAGVEVIATIDVTDISFYNTYILPYGATFDYTGLIQQIAFSDLDFRGITDANGAYSIDIPSTTNGLKYKVSMSDFATNQTLLLNTLNTLPVYGPQTMRTIFAAGNVPSTVPTVAAAYVEFSAPTGAPQLEPDVTATATAVVSESGIASINIFNEGSGYTQPPIVKISAPTNIHYGENAEAEAAITNGKVTAINITNPGSGYAANLTPTVTLVSKEGTNAAATAHFTYSIYDYNVTTGGNGYETRPNVSITSDMGSGASAQAIMSGYVKEFELTNPGSGYVCTPKVVVTGSQDGNNATATAVMSTHNPIHSIKLSQNYLDNNFFEAPPVVEITGAVGSGATAMAQLATAGRVRRIEVINGGLGYTEAPSVNILGGGGYGAQAWATINASGSVTAINIATTSAGTGYTSVPTVEISAPPVGGTQATAQAVLEYPIAQMVITNPGGGYNIAYVNPTQYSNQPTVIIDGTILTNNIDVWVRPNMSVAEVTVTGSGTKYEYQSTPVVSFVSIDGNGGGASASAVLRYSVWDLDVIEEGDGYEFASNIVVNIDQPTDEGTAAAANALRGRAKLSSIELIEGGEGYTAAPNVRYMVTISGVNYDCGAKITATVSNGAVTGFTITDANVLPQINGTTIHNTALNGTLSISTFLGSASASATANPESGKIQFVQVTNAGAGYQVAPIVRFTRLDNAGNVVDNQDNSNFSNAEATAILVDGRVASIEVTNPGSGYYYTPDVELVVQTATLTAKGTATINTDGVITGISVTNAGNGYIEAPTVTITPSVPGMGTGATAIAVLDGSVVDRVIMTNNGSGYIGKNRPTSAVAYPTGLSVVATSSKAIVKDLNLGTGLRTGGTSN